MTSFSPFLSVDCPCDQALQATKTRLLQAGLSTVQTFDLRTARLGSHACCCPNHGAEACDCQMIVLLVYGKAAEPATLILHGNEGKTWISVINSPLHPTDAKLIINIQRVLESQAFANL